MSDEDTIRASAHQRDCLLSLIGDPATWRGRAIGQYGKLTTAASADVVMRARDLADAVELYQRLWAHFCRVEQIVADARHEAAPWRPAAWSWGWRKGLMLLWIRVGDARQDRRDG